MLDLSNRAVEQNNEAVAQLQVGKVRDAASSLKHAITSLREECINSETTSSSTTCTENQLAQLPPPSSSPSSPSHYLQEPNSVLDASFSSINSSEEQDVMDLEQDDHSWKLVTGIASVPIMPESTVEDASLHISIYDHAFSINEGEDRQDLICAVIFYNLALVQHKRNLHRGRNLCKVLGLYERAASVAQNLDVCPQDKDSILLLLLAICNNMMQIHATLFDRSSVQHLLLQLQHLVGGRPTNDDGDGGEDERLDFFVLNTICFGVDQYRCAPVA